MGFLNMTVISTQKDQFGIDSWTNRIIAYIDILGIKKHVQDESNESKKKLLQLLKIFHDANSSYEPNKVFEKIQRGPISVEFVKTQLEISNFSDHVIFSALLSENCKHTQNNQINAVIEKIQEMSLRVLQIGFLIRGAITIGDMYHLGNSIIGKGLNEAVFLEENIAIYPRVIVSDDILKILNKNQTNGFLTYNFILKKDFDGVTFIDFLHRHRHGDEASDIDLRQIKFAIESEINKSINRKDVKTLTKLRWFANYFNDTFITWGVKNNHLISALEPIEPITL